jgi:uncharacterized protein with FMN-binding domain
MKLSRAHRHIPSLIMAVAASIPIVTAFEMMTHRGSTPTGAPPPVAPARSGSAQPRPSATPSTPAGAAPKGPPRPGSTQSPPVISRSRALGASPASTPRYGIKSPTGLGKLGANPADHVRVVKPSTRTSRKPSKTGAASQAASRVRSAAAPSGTFTGPQVSDLFGVVQATVTVVQGTITDVGITAPKSNPVSANINSQAVGYLRTETLNAQSANISTISGATATSQAYLQSLQGALAKIPKSTPSKSNGRSHRRTVTGTSQRLAKAPSGSAPHLRLKGGNAGGSVRVVKPAQLYSSTRRTASKGAAAAHARSTSAISGTHTGPSVSDPYGVVQTTITVTRGRITNVAITAPMDNSVSSTINSQAIGYLRTETLNAQSANISAISGATATSQAYVQSLQAALAQMPRSTAPSQPSGPSHSGTAPSQKGAGSRGSKPPAATAAPSTIPHFAIKGGANDDSSGDDGGSVRVVKPVHLSSTTSGTASGTSSAPPAAPLLSHSIQHFAIKGGSNDDSGREGGSAIQAAKSTQEHAHKAGKHSKHSPAPKDA